MNTTTALGTNATFFCSGNGQVLWEISNRQVRSQALVQAFAQQLDMFVPLPTTGSSELIVKGTLHNNSTRPIRCIVEPNSVLDPNEESDVVYLLVYGECILLLFNYRGYY